MKKLMKILCISLISLSYSIFPMQKADKQPSQDYFEDDEIDKDAFTAAMIASETKKKSEEYFEELDEATIKALVDLKTPEKPAPSSRINGNSGAATKRLFTEQKETEDSKKKVKEDKKSLLQALAEENHKPYNCLVLPRAFFSPDIKAVILNLINNEQEEINAALYHFSLYDFAQAWALRKKLNNIKGFLIVNEDFQREPCAALRHLIENGITVGSAGARAGEYGIMHAKFMIFKNNTIQGAGKKLLVHGSCNATPAGHLNNDEHMTIEDNQNLITQFEEKLHQIAEKSTLIALQECKCTNVHNYKTPFAITMAKIKHGIPENLEL
jgi:hypothetical protein